MRRHFCRVTVPPKASSAASPCSAASFALPHPLSPAVRCDGQIVRLIHATQLYPATLEGAARRGQYGRLRPARLRRPVGQRHLAPEAPAQAPRPNVLSQPLEPTRGKEEPGTKVRPCDGAATTEARCPAAPREDGRRSRSVRTTQAKRRVRARVGFHVLSPPQVGRTPGISCEAVPASEMVRRGHEPALLPRNGAGESFVSFIALLGGAVQLQFSIFRP